MKQIVTLLIIVAMASGCQTPTHERAFMSLGATEPPVTKNVRYSGQYRLYSSPPRSPSTRNATPLMETRLAKGELLGFALSDSGNLMAVIRTEQKPLSNTASYTWTVQPDPGQFDADRTILLVVAVMFVGGITLGIVAAANRPFK